MRRKVTSLLRKGNLTPKERVLLLVADKVGEERYGKPILSDADRVALYNWTPKSLSEEREFSIYWEGWELAVLGSADAHTVALRFINRCLVMMIKLAWVFWRGRQPAWLKPAFTDNQALDALLANSGFELDSLLKEVAFYSLSEELRQKFEDYHALEEEQADDSAYTQWLQAKVQAKETIQKLIDKGELAIAEREFDTRKITLITGDSLYRCSVDLDFINAYKRQVERLKQLGYVILFFQKEDPVADYALLLGFLELFKRISKVYQVDVTYKIMEWIDACRKIVVPLNHQIAQIEQELRYSQSEMRYWVTILPKALCVDLDNVKPDIPERYYERFKELFDDF